MEWIPILLLAAAGVVAGFVAGLIGVGGGIIFAPVLFFYFSATDVAAGVVTPLTIGSSLCCTLVAALASAWYQLRKAAVDARMAASVGVFSAAAVYAMTRYVTTQPWYDAAVFQIAFSAALLAVVVRMLRSQGESGEEAAREAEGRQRSSWWLAGTGTIAGAVSSAVGVGGGIVLVPAYHRWMRLPMHRAVGTSSATIVLISLAGAATYAALGWGTSGLPASALGFVDVGRAALLAVPAVVSARWGVAVAHRINTTALRWTFAGLALVVAVRLLSRALG